MTCVDPGTRLAQPTANNVAELGSLLMCFMSSKSSEQGFGTLFIAEETASVFAVIGRYRRRGFSQTRNGRLSIVPRHAHAGDVVCVFFGGDVPFILREDGHGPHRLVGEAYVHGHMDGEAIDMHAVETREFKIR
jgi:hypothetical protein